MAGQFIGVGGVCRKVKDQFMGVAGVARKVKRAYVGVGGVTRSCYAGDVTVSRDGLSYGQTISSWSKVTGTVTIQGDADFYNANSSRLGALWLDDPASVTVDITGDSCTATLNSRYVYVDWWQNGEENYVEVRLTFGPDGISGKVAVNYNIRESNGLWSEMDLSAFDVSFNLTFTI